MPLDGGSDLENQFTEESRREISRREMMGFLLLLFAGKDRLCNCNMEIMGTLKLKVTHGQITNGCGFELLLWTWLTNLHPWHNEEGQ